MCAYISTENIALIPSSISVTVYLSRYPSFRTLIPIVVLLAVSNTLIVQMRVRIVFSTLSRTDYSIRKSLLSDTHNAIQLYYRISLILAVYTALRLHFTANFVA